MGYELACNGVIKIDPPIRWVNIRSSPFLPDGDDELDIMLVLDSITQETDDGATTVHRAVGVEQRYDQDPRNRHIVQQLQRLVDAYPDHEFIGRLVCEGEEAADLWRIEVVNRKVTPVLPRIVWPDGSETQHPRNKEYGNG